MGSTWLDIREKIATIDNLLISSYSAKMEPFFDRILICDEKCMKSEWNVYLHKENASLVIFHGFLAANSKVKILLSIKMVLPSCKTVETQWSNVMDSI